MNEDLVIAVVTCTAQLKVNSMHSDGQSSVKFSRLKINNEV